MGATNTTANYSLSQFIGTDKPAWLQDYNGDMLKIDTGINAAKVAADGAQNAASAAQNDATTANNAITNTINPAITSLNTTVGSQGGAINTINSLIGNGTPTTTNQTIIGAINEINAITPRKRVTINNSGTDVRSDMYNQLKSTLDGLSGEDLSRCYIRTKYANSNEEKLTFNQKSSYGYIFTSFTWANNLAWSLVRVSSTSIVEYGQNTFAGTDVSSNTDLATIELYY